MANSILIKRSAVAAKIPATTDLQLGELALNTYDGKLFLKKNDGADAIVEVGAVKSVAGKTGAVTLVSADVGLSQTENKSSATIRSEITSGNVTTALGFTPYNATNPANYITSAGAPVQSVFGRTGAVTLASGDVTSALTYTPVNPSVIGAANGVASLDSTGKIVSSQLPAITITDTFVVASQAAMLALTVQTGDVAVRTDLNKSFIVKGVDGSVIGNWQELLTPTDAVLSVAGRTGAVSLAQADIAGLTTASNVFFNSINVAGVNVGGNGAAMDPYGTIGVTEPSDANNWSYFGMTRAGQIGTGFGLTGTAGALGHGMNAMWFGPATSGSGGKMSSAWLAFDAGSLTIPGQFQGAGTGLTGTAASLSIGGNAATATTAGNVTGVVAIANGGTGSTSVVGALNALTAMGIQNYQLGAGVDLNTLTTSGYYYQNSDANIATGGLNWPIAYSGKLTVTNSLNSIGLWQEYSTYNGPGVRTFRRQFYNSTWSPWLESMNMAQGSVVNPGTAKAGDIKVTGGIISIYDGSAWKQVFPAVYA